MANLIEKSNESLEEKKPKYKSTHEPKPKQDKAKNKVKDGGTAAFNMGLATLQRIDNLLTFISNNYIKLNALNTRQGIKSLYYEVTPKLSEKERNNFDRLFLKLSKIGELWVCSVRYIEENSVRETFLEYKHKRDPKVLTIKKCKSIKDKCRNKYWTILSDLRLMLSDLLEKRGFLIPNKVNTWRISSDESSS